MCFLNPVFILKIFFNINYSIFVAHKNCPMITMPGTSSYGQIWFCKLNTIQNNITEKERKEYFLSVAYV